MSAQKVATLNTGPSFVAVLCIDTVGLCSVQHRCWHKVEDCNITSDGEAGNKTSDIHPGPPTSTGGWICEHLQHHTPHFEHIIHKRDCKGPAGGACSGDVRDERRARRAYCCRYPTTVLSCPSNVVSTSCPTLICSSLSSHV